MPNYQVSFCAFLFLIVKISGSEEIQLEQNFRQIGTLATGLSYAHIHGTVNFRQLRTAYLSIIHYVENREQTTESKEEKLFIETLSPQLRVAEKTLEDIRQLFFARTNAREKRQLFLGIAMALGVVNSGMSIYNTAQIKKIYSILKEERTEMINGFRHVAHALIEEDHAIHQLSLNVEILKNTCKYVLERIENESNQINALTNIIKLITLVNNLNAELIAWGRGLDALSNGRLHPTLINTNSLKKGFRETVEKARQFGLKPLHEQMSYLFKCPISYIATEEEEILIFIHIPLVEQDPLNLFEYLPIPKQIGNLFVTIESTKSILASDLQGQYGLELSEMDLIRCQTEDRHNGKLFICPNTNLVENQVRRTCLGALFFGHATEAIEKCLYFPHKLEHREEFAKQIALDQIIFSARENITIIETCPDSIRTLQNVTGLTTIKVPPGCKIITENFTFKSPIVIDTESDFIRRTIRIPRLPLLSDDREKDIENRLEDLKKIKSPNRLHLSEFQDWIKKMDNDNLHQNAGYLVNAITLVIGLTVICALVFLFLRYKKTKTPNN